jgi:polyisoprenoid-binding protein YceI
VRDERMPVDLRACIKMTQSYARSAGFVAALVCGFAFLLFAAGLCAQDTVVRFDPANTKIDFTLGATLHTVHGTFKLKSGEIHLDAATGRASGAIVVDATSGDSGDSSRDHNMHTNILESTKFPEIVFSPTLITPQPGHTVKESLGSKGTSELHANGLFNLHGQNHDITMDMSVENDGNGHVLVTTAFPVPYIKWGLKSPNTFLLHVSDSVDLTIHGTGQIISGH